MAYIRIFPLEKEPIQDPRGGWVNFTDVSIDTNPKFQHLLTSHDFVILNQADEITRLREALEKIANNPDCNISGGDYRIGVADGHRCQAEIARAVLEPANA